MTSVLGIGVATLDIINVTLGYPAEDAEVRAISQTQRRGGNVCNTLVVLSRLGHQCRWRGSLGDDGSALSIQRDLEQAGVTIDPLNQRHGNSPTSYITVNQETGSRTIVHYRDLPELSYDDFLKTPLTGVHHCHFEGRNIPDTAKMIRHLQQHYPHLPYSVEIEKPRADIDQLANGAEVVFYSKHFATALGYHNATDFLRRHPKVDGAAWLVCPWGAMGAYYKDATGSSVQHHPTAPLPQIVDSIGAGDTFIAGFLHRYWQTKNPQAATAFATQLATKKCAMLGFRI